MDGPSVTSAGLEARLQPIPGNLRGILRAVMSESIDDLILSAEANATAYLSRAKFAKYPAAIPKYNGFPSRPLSMKCPRPWKKLV